MKKIMLVFFVSTLVLLLSSCANTTTYTPPKNNILKLSNVIDYKKKPIEEDYTKLGVTDYESFNRAEHEWNVYRNGLLEEFNIPEGFYNYIQKTAKAFLTDNSNTNVVYSPINVYLALSILSEVTSGSAQAELLSLLGFSNFNTFRRDIKSLMDITYRNDDKLKIYLNNSIWLSDRNVYKNAVLDILANYYYSSSFSGTMGDPKYSNVFRSWLNSGTNNLLKSQIQDIEFDYQTIFAIASTIYFKSNWQSHFNELMTTEDSFYLNNNEEVLVDFMHNTINTSYYKFENGFLVRVPFIYGGYMYFVLPKEGTTPHELLDSDDFNEFLKDNKGIEYRFGNVNLSIPKFDVSSKMDFIEILKGLGVNEIFEAGSDKFSNLIDRDDICVTDCIHGARVLIDEEGCEAAAFTVILNKATSVGPTETIEFVLDRPFLFMVSSGNDIPLFLGLVNNPKVN